MVGLSWICTLLLLYVAIYYKAIHYYIDNNIISYEFSKPELRNRFNCLIDFSKFLPDKLKRDECKSKLKYSSNSYVAPKKPSVNRKQIGRENATIVMLARNFELEGALDSIRSLEDRFNKDYKYPWIFLNDVPFDDEFIEQTSLMASGETFYEIIPKEDWDVPHHINEVLFEANLASSEEECIIYGGSKSYRNMCHFNSGFFYKQKRLLEYEWYFRVDTDVEYLCDFSYDPFQYLRENNKIYGFVVAIQEYENTIPTLWKTTEEFMNKYPDLIHPNNALEFLTTKESEINHEIPIIKSNSSYNLCHFWSNFEIGNLEFFRGEAYETFFHYLDKAGGFYYERWGDAPVHTIALSLLADKNSIHHFEDIGYYHAPYMTCPSSKDILAVKRCICRTIGGDGKVQRTPYDVQPFSCLSRWWRYGAGKSFISDVEYNSKYE